jgi:hypothetical protein
VQSQLKLEQKISKLHSFISSIKFTNNENVHSPQYMGHPLVIMVLWLIL